MIAGLAIGFIVGGALFGWLGFRAGKAVPSTPQRDKFDQLFKEIDEAQKKK